MIVTKSMSALGAKAGSRQHASLNSEVMRTFVGTNRGNSIVLHIDGSYYLDLSSGPIKISFGRNELIDVKIHGPGSLIGVVPSSHTTPVLEISRDIGSIQSMILRNLTISSAGSGIRIVRGGSHCKLVDISIRDCTGHSPNPIDYTGWSDIYDTTYGLRIENSDGFFCEDVVVMGCAGHGVICDRWHAGGWRGYVRQCKGAGMKLQRLNGTSMHCRVESNGGYGLMVRDSGIGRYITRSERVDAGAGDYWRVWQENNGSRSAVGISKSYGHRFPGIKLVNCGGKTITGHLGCNTNQIILDHASKYLCQFNETLSVPPFEPDRLTTEINPPEPYRWKSNWHTTWDDVRYRPIFSPENLEVVCPPYSIDRVAIPSTAYWRLFEPLDSPGTFIYKMTVRDMTGAIARWCHVREQSEDKLRQTARRFCISIDPVAGAITPFSLWDTDPVTFTGAITVDDTRNDITLSLATFIEGIETVRGGVEQTEEHRLQILDAGLWKLPIGE